MSGPDGTRYAAAPFGRAGLVLLLARTTRAAAARSVPPAFHTSELDRIAQLVRATAAILGERLDLLAAPGVGAGDGSSR